MSDYSPQGFRMLPTVVKNLLIINIIIFLATMVLEKYGYNNIKLLFESDLRVLGQVKE